MALLRVGEVLTGLWARFARPSDLQVSRVPGAELPPVELRRDVQALVLGMFVAAQDAETGP